MKPGIKKRMKEEKERVYITSNKLNPRTQRWARTGKEEKAGGGGLQKTGAAPYPPHVILKNGKEKY